MDVDHEKPDFQLDSIFHSFLVMKTKKNKQSNEIILTFALEEFLVFKSKEI